jgi:methylated-DNA-[protein]-cysteine S-methyltransferase
VLEWVIAECAEGLPLRLTAGETGLRSIDFDVTGPPSGEPAARNPILEDAVRQLRAYFAGSLRTFTLPLDPLGTEFQKRVWRELVSIPFGEIRSYTQIAQAIGAPRAVRAVGAANGANPLPIVVPCHRVIGASGKLVGYGGGLPLKKRLLDLEGCNMLLFRI